MSERLIKHCMIAPTMLASYIHFIYHKTPLRPIAIEHAQYDLLIDYFDDGGFTYTNVIRDITTKDTYV